MEINELIRIKFVSYEEALEYCNEHSISHMNIGFIDDYYFIDIDKKIFNQYNTNTNTNTKSNNLKRTATSAPAVYIVVYIDNETDHIIEWKVLANNKDEAKEMCEKTLGDDCYKVVDVYRFV